jgi:hypothetical protein
MTAIRLLAELHDAGIRLAVNGEKIRAEPTRGTIPAPLLQRIADHKPALHDLLITPAGDTLRTLLDLAIDEGLPAAVLAGLSAKDLHACYGVPQRTLSRVPARAGAPSTDGGESAGRMDTRHRLRGMRACAAMAGRPACRHRLPVVPA